LTVKAGENHLIKTGIGIYGVFSNLDLSILRRGFPDGFSLSQSAPYLTLSQIPVNEFKQEYKGRLALFPVYYLQDDMQLIENTLFLNLGVNIQWLNVSKGWIVDPRAGIKLSLPEFVDFKLAGGIYSQFPITKDFGRILDEKYGNPDIKPEKSYHIVFGIEKDLDEFFVRTEGFYKYYDDLVTIDHALNFVNGEIGQSYGFEFFFQKKIGKDLDGWISYTFVVTKRKVAKRTPDTAYLNTKGPYEIPFDTWYYPEYDRRHSLNIILNYDFNPKWKLAMTYKFGTGTPYTDIVGGVKYGIDTNGDNANAEEFFYNPIRGEYNSKRIPYYMNLDVKLTMPFFWDNWSCYIQVINALYNENIVGYNYDQTYAKKKESTGIPFPVPIFGIRAEF
jgi:outer membrane receptor protein involved in Fe transport